MTSTESNSCETEMFSANPSSTQVERVAADATASPSYVLSQALDILDISSVGSNEKQPSPSSSASGRPRSAPSMSASSRASPINSTVVSFPTKAVAHSHTSRSTTQINIVGTHQTRPKLVRLNSIDSCSTTTTVSTTTSFSSITSSSSSSTVSSPSNSPVASPKRSIFQSYWDRNGTPRANRQTTMSFSNIPKVTPSEEDSRPAQQQLDHLGPSTFDGTSATAAKSTTSGDQPSTPRSATVTVTLPEGYQHTGTTTSASSPKRSIFGDRAMQTARRSSPPDIPSIADTLLTESNYMYSTYMHTDHHRVRHVRKTSSTDHLVRVRKSCLRRVALYSGSGSELRKSASTISTATAAVTASNLQPRQRASTLPQPVVQFDPEVRVYEFHRTAEEPNRALTSSNDWSHLFA